MTVLNDENFNDLIKEGVVLVDFYATWCGPCKMMKIVLDEIDKECDINIVKIDVDKHEDLARSYGIMSIPTLIFYKDGELKNKIVGFIDKNSILDMVKEL